MERIRNRLTEVRSRLTGIFRTRDEAVSHERAQLQQENATFETTSIQLKEELDKKIETLNQKMTEGRKQLQEHWRKRVSRFSVLISRAKEKIEREFQEKIVVLEDQQKLTHNESTHSNDDKVVEFKKKCAETMAELEEIKAAAEARRQHILAFTGEYGVVIKDAEPTPVADDSTPGEFEPIENRLTECERLLDDARRRLRHTIPPALGYTLLIAVCALTGIYFQTAHYETIFVIGAGVALVILLPLLYTIYHSRSGEALEAGVKLLGHLGGTMGMIERQKVLLTQQHETGLTTLDAERVQRICDTFEKLEHQCREVNRIGAEALAKLESRRAVLNTKMAQRRKDSTQKSEAEFKRKSEEMRSECQRRITESNTKHVTRKAEIETECRTKVDKLAAEWNSILVSLEKFCMEERQRSATNAPGEAVVLPTTFKEEVHIGDIRLELRDLGIPSDPEGRFSIPASVSKMQLPACLSFPMNGCLLLRSSPAQRKRGLEILFNAIMRLLSSFPPAKAKLTIMDPIGLGQNFAALMHLADYDETLVNGRIWSDTVHIERKLTELTEHMEKVIQKYLRNRYATINDYNKEAGELAEPYRFLVIADFPTGFSEMAIERLSSIITSGVRCGVYTLILHDSRQKLPQPLDETQLRRNGMLVIETNNGLALDEEVLARPVFGADEPLAPAAIDDLINAIGKQCREAGRVQVPFGVICPKPEKYWSNTSEGGIRVPLGKTGADRLQFMDLGKGTAQHALVAGKTGSGKSNLVHVIITSAALWYSPKEVEFYLIDFKKGVEFKTYAANRLPHVRVVAVESDREFGLSVLRRIDKELTRRGEQFRKMRVQDFADYRKAAGAEVLPRTLLIVDEFQEFFTDDDEVSQDAALLLDRIVRQGRAFGIHVVLGTQTLGGTYTLSKSTLGQMAVRIALQCNESDSYLILNDDNAAAALLSRPGEAIYNDQSGLVEGNNPFQAVFLPRDMQEPILRSLREKSIEQGMESVISAVVFEGNSLSDLRNNSLLREATLHAPEVGKPDKVWLGEPNAIKGPTEVEFSSQAGSNLLVIGHRGGSEVAMCCATVLSLAAGNTPQNLHIRILDGTVPESGARDRLMALKNALPHDIEIVDPRQSGKVIEELAALAKSRQETETETQQGEKYYLLILGLEKFRALRQDDEFAFSSSGDDGASPAKAYNEVLVEGPNQGIHSIVWCDTLSNLNRTMSRKALREFETRVLFQMSTNDSSELIDSPAANKLGLYSAMLFTTHNGAIEKFRPYGLPDVEVLGEMGHAIKTRGASSGARSMRPEK